ncbi:hypothetical protein P692DRAFT_20815171 [Suillus brevipes Sb2]|nr:hypothetical protein P692DRAFT_20815171 [Suillus brevipes Sb2]
MSSSSDSRSSKFFPKTPLNKPSHSPTLVHLKTTTNDSDCPPQLQATEGSCAVAMRTPSHCPLAIVTRIMSYPQRGSEHYKHQYQRLWSHELDLIKGLHTDEIELSAKHLNGIDLQIGSIRNLLQDRGVTAIGDKGGSTLTRHTCAENAGSGQSARSTQTDTPRWGRLLAHGVCADLATQTSHFLQAGILMGDAEFNQYTRVRALLAIINVSTDACFSSDKIPLNMMQCFLRITFKRILNLAVKSFHPEIYCTFPHKKYTTLCLKGNSKNREEAALQTIENFGFDTSIVRQGLPSLAGTNNLVDTRGLGGGAVSVSNLFNSDNKF